MLSILVDMNIYKGLKFLGLTENEVEIYLLLARAGWCTVLQLSRLSLIKRTTLYRILESLIDKGLVEIQVSEKTTLYGAFNTNNLNDLVAKKEKELNLIKDSLKVLDTEFKLISSLSPQKISVHFYKGKAGIQQSEWNMVEKKDSQVYIIASPISIYLHKTTGDEFAEEIRQKYIDQKIKLSEISNKDIAIKIKLDGSVPWTKNREYIKNHYVHRVLPDEILKIKTDIIIFDDRIHFYSVEEKEYVIVEIISQNLKDMMFEMFKQLWNKSKAIDNFSGQDL